MKTLPRRVGKLCFAVVLGLLLTSCFTYRPFTNANRGKSLDTASVRAMVQVGERYQIKLADTREVWIKVKTMDRYEIRGDAQVAQFSGDHFRHSETVADYAIRLTNISEIQNKRFSWLNTFILIGAGVLVPVIAHEINVTSYH